MKPAFSFHLTKNLYLLAETACGRIVRTEIKSEIIHTGSWLSDEASERIAIFIKDYINGIWRPVEDRYFLIPEKLEKYADLLFYLKNSIPSGTTTTYGTLAGRFGLHPRTVGMAMAKNPFPILVPCHRVLSSNSKLTGFSAEGGIKTKKFLLEWENTLK